MNLRSFDFGALAMFFFITILTVSCGLTGTPEATKNETQVSQTGFTPLTASLFKKLQGRSYYLMQSNHTCTTMAGESSVASPYIDRIILQDYQKTEDGKIFVSGQTGDKCNDTIAFVSADALSLSSDYQQIKFKGKSYRYFAQEPH